MSKISVIILNYNKSSLIDRAIRSIENQIITPNIKLEIVIVDDGSKDNPGKWLKKYKNQKSKKIFYLKKNKGVGFCSNFALKKISSKYYVRLDSDDYISQFYIQICHDLLENNPKIGFVFSDLFRVDEFDNKIKIISRKKNNNLLAYGAGIVIRKKIVSLIGNYDKHLKNCEDYDFMARILKRKITGYHLPVPYYRYFKTKFSLTGNKSRQKCLELMEKKYEF